jgi:fructokinase
VVKLTDEEAEWLFGIPDALENPTRVHDELSNAQAVLVTAGEKGASYSLFGCTGRVEAFHVPVVETTGAGDAFTAGFLHALCTISNRNNEEMDKLSQEEKAEAANDVIRFASAVGALTCTKEGAIAAQPTLDQVESFLIHGEKVWS